MAHQETIDSTERIEALIRTIRDAEQELQSLTGGQLDAVVSGTGEAYLLHEAQDRLVQSREAERAISLTQRAILDALPAHLALVDAEGVVRVVNAAWKAFGEANQSQDPGHGVGTSYLAVSRDAAGLGAESAAEVASGLEAVLRGEIASFALEYPCDSPTERRWFRVMITPVRDERIRGAVVMHLDVTEKRASETALQASEQALRESRTLQLLAERMGRIGGWRIELPRYTVTWSDQVCAIHGVPAGTTPTTSQALQMYDPAQHDMIREVFTECAEYGVPFDIEVQVIDGNEHRWARAIGQAQRNDMGEIVALEGALQDISEQKRLEQQFLRAQRMESVGTLAGGIAHDLNNVLTPILMSTEMLRMTDTDDERLELVDGIEQAAKRGADMVRQVLTFARGTEGKRVHVQLPALIHEVQKIARETFPRNIVIRTEISGNIPPVLGDSTQLHQVFVNLCVNARDAMPLGGTITIRVSEVLLDAQYAGMSTEVIPGSYVLAEIADTGLGMSPRVLERIFEPFFTTKEQGKGTGLGLSTSVAIVKSHGGFMRASSEQDVGSWFRVYLPAAAVTDMQLDERRVSTVPRGNGELILVVDDEAAVRGITQHTLETFGYQVLTASDGAEGVAVFAAHRDNIKLVLTDMMMPVMDGGALIEVIQRMDASARIIAASGIPDHGNAIRVPQSRVREFLPKPYTAETLLSTVRLVLDS